jgi:high-affinity K+ transport system ATPase subunit B
LLVCNIAQGAPAGFELQITLWLWFTVLFANFAEAMAEGRGKAQADTLRRAKTETVAVGTRSTHLARGGGISNTARGEGAWDERR